MIVRAAFSISIGLLALAVMVGATGPVSDSWAVPASAIIISLSVAAFWFLEGKRGTGIPARVRVPLCLIFGWLAARPMLYSADFTGNFFSPFALAAIWLAGLVALVGVIASPPSEDEDTQFERLAPALALAAGLVFIPLGFLWFLHGVWETLGTVEEFYFATSALLAAAAALVSTSGLSKIESPRRLLLLFTLLGAAALLGRSAAELIF